MPSKSVAVDNTEIEFDLQVHFKHDGSKRMRITDIKHNGNDVEELLSFEELKKDIEEQIYDMYGKEVSEGDANLTALMPAEKIEIEADVMPYQPETRSDPEMPAETILTSVIVTSGDSSVEVVDYLDESYSENIAKLVEDSIDNELEAALSYKADVAADREIEVEFGDQFGG